MSWFRVDDGFPEHPKLEALEANPRRYMAAITVWTIMGADCSRRLTDGFVSAARLEKVLGQLGKPAVEGAEALVDCGLWVPVEGGWQFYSWSEYQPTKAEVEDARRKKRERQKKWRLTKGDADVAAPVDALQDVPRDASRDDAHIPSSSRPLPVPSSSLPHLAARDGVARAIGDQFDQTRAIVRREFARRFEAAEGSMWTRAGDPAVDTLASWLLSLRDGTTEANLARTLDAFFADAWCRSKHFNVAHLARHPGNYFEPRETPSTAPQTASSARAEAKAALMRGDMAEMVRLQKHADELEQQEARRVRR